MKKANTRETAGATGVVVALEPVSKMAADITDDRALASKLAACPERVKMHSSPCGDSMSATNPIGDSGAVRNSVKKEPLDGGSVFHGEH
jgi:hypothetical protein